MSTSAKKSQKPAAPHAVNAFAGKHAIPTEDDVTVALGPVKRTWDGLVGDLTRENGMTAEWGSSSVKAGWSLRLKLRDRIIVYLIPNQGAFQAALVLGDKAVKAAKESALPASIRKIISESRRYAEGTGIRIPLKSGEEVAAIKCLARIKLEN